MKRFAAVAALSLSLAVSADGGELLIPVVYRGGGDQNTLWRTEITVTNITHAPAFPATARVTLERQNEVPQSVDLPLRSMEGVSAKDALQQWFNLDSASGIVRVTWPEETVTITASARIYNVGASGEYGQSVPALALDALRVDNFLTGLKGQDGNRTNIGVANPHDENVIVTIELFDHDGRPRGSNNLGIPARSFRQFNDIFSLMEVEPQSIAVVRVKGFDRTIYPYASVVRNDTGDATFVVPAR